jgi:hypothetical protein
MPEQFVTGELSSTSSLELDIAANIGSVVIQLAGTFSATIQFEASGDDDDWVGVNGVPVGGGAPVTSATAPGAWLITGSGFFGVRARVSSYASGIIVTSIATSRASAFTSVVVGPGTPGSPSGGVISVQNVGSSTVSNAPAQQSVSNTSSSILAANAARKEATIVNTNTTAIFLGLGQTPTDTAYHIALSACSAANDGTGGTYTTDLWKGAINAICASSGTVCVTELT